MFDGYGLLTVQLAVLLAVGVLLGLLAGRYVWPRRPSARASTAQTSASSAGSAGSVVPYAGLPSASPLPTPEPSAVAQLAHRLASSEAEVVRLRAAVRAVADHKDTEMGRLETGAIEALDALIADHTARVAMMEAEITAATDGERNAVRDLEAERRRTLRLQAALAQRDEQLAALMANAHGLGTPPSDAG
jgi:hypothetical protein